MLRFKILPSLFLGLILISSCRRDEETETPDANEPYRDYRGDMRQFVIGIAEYARSIDSDFIIIPQNGHDLCVTGGSANSALATDYIAHIDGQGREELYYGYDNNDDQLTPANETTDWKMYLDRMNDEGIRVLVTDYCSSTDNINNSYTWNQAAGFLSFAADARDLNTIPALPAEPWQNNTSNITNLQEAQNFLYLINPDQFASKTDFLNALSGTNYDVIIMDAYFEDAAYTSEELDIIRTKANGGQRLLIAYMSIGEAEDYRPYWDNSWNTSPPSWLLAGNPDWPGNYKVNYWDSTWHNIIYGNPESYTHYLLSAGFDGAYLDIIDAFEYFE
jgi:cysteinyl-tRNA synthetase, unknown class